MSTQDRDVFTLAANRWSNIITRDVDDILRPPGDYASFCEYSDPSVPLIIDDLYICASTPRIDGAGRVLGRAGPFLVRTQDGLPVAASMEFDSADLAQLRRDGKLYDVILHEMGEYVALCSCGQVRTETFSFSPA